MSWLARDDLDRTGKLLLDTGRASDPADAARQLQQFRFQIVVGRDIDRDLAAQPALLTAINAGKRALLGGVYVSVLDDPVLRLPWVRGQRLTDAIATAGGHLAGEHDPKRADLRGPAVTSHASANCSASPSTPPCATPAPSSPRPDPPPVHLDQRLANCTGDGPRQHSVQ